MSGDEVGALVFDAGSHSFRVGFAGEEFPTTIVPRANCEMKNFMSDGMIEDWDLLEHLLDYTYKECLFANSEEHPVLFSESAWNEKPKRERLTELMFEKYNCPAFFLAKNAVLTAFSQGRTSALILDSGATQTSAVPVHDGYCVTHAIARSPIGGNLIVEQLNKVLADMNVDLVPTYRIKSKEEVDYNEAPIWTEKTDLPVVTESYDAFMKKMIIEDLGHNIMQLCDTPMDPEQAEKLPAAPYHFPNGLTKEFLVDRIKVPEGLFDLNYLRDVDTSSLMNVADIAVTSAGMCDIDIRASLYANLIITGGNSLILGFTERLNHDLAHRCPSTIRLRPYAAPTSVEKRFGAWIGGSILASVGTFQQMWISKSEYDEHGRGIVDKKCA